MHAACIIFLLNITNKELVVKKKKQKGAELNYDPKD